MTQVEIAPTKFYIVKAPRFYEGVGYSGPACAKAGVEPGKLYDNMEDALSDAKKLTIFNPVGFRVVTTITMENMNES